MREERYGLGWNNPFQASLEDTHMSVGVHACVCLCFHMCVWLDEGVGAQCV